MNHVVQCTLSFNVALFTELEDVESFKPLECKGNYSVTSNEVGILVVDG